VKAVLGGALLLMVSTNACVKALELYERIVLLDFTISPSQPHYDSLSRDRAQRDKVFLLTYTDCADALK